MVDPNRKINRLTEKDIVFLEECEQEFASRFTEDDAEFMAHCSKPLSDPPIIENWNSGGGDFPRSDGRFHNRGGNRNPRSWSNNFGHRRGRRDNYDNPNGSSMTYRRVAFKQNQNSDAPINIRKDYNNFVAASKND